jgi:hypothetical protein
MSKEIKSEIIKLRKKSKFAYVGSINEEGFPQTKCMCLIRSIQYSDPVISDHSIRKHPAA